MRCRRSQISPLLQMKANLLLALKRWEYEPTVHDGKPVSVIFNVTVSSPARMR